MTKTQTIFEDQFDVKNVILAVLLLIFCVGLYHSLYSYLLRKYLQELFFTTKHFKSILNRSIVYLFLLSAPMLILTLICVFYNNSLLGLETSMTMDEVNILIVSGYICWKQESRHTPIRGMHLIRDVLFAMLLIGMYVDSFISGSLSIGESFLILVIGLIYYFILVYFEGIQEFLLKILGMKESKNYNAKYLLTSKHDVADFLQIKDIIGEKKQVIQEELSDYKEILMNLQQNQEDQEILMNFAKLFLPIKKAYEIKQEMTNKAVLEEIQDTWQEGSQHQSEQQAEHEDYHIHNGPTWNDSTSGFGTFNKTSTFTDDFIKEQDQQDYELNIYEKIMRYAFYPIYLATFAEGRLFYLVGYLALFTLIGLMFGIANSTVYFSQAISGFSIISIVVALLLFYPSAKYCLKISTNNDYDFTNIFLQSMILKLVLTGVAFIFYTLGIYFNIKVLDPQFSIGKGAFMNLIARIVLLGVYLAFMIINRFATRFTNFKFFIAIILILWTAEVIAQNLINVHT